MQAREKEKKEKKERQKEARKVKEKAKESRADSSPQMRAADKEDNARGCMTG